LSAPNPGAERTTFSTGTALRALFACASESTPLSYTRLGALLQPQYMGSTASELRVGKIESKRSNVYVLGVAREKDVHTAVI
jgi:hypothetical protein